MTTYPPPELLYAKTTDYHWPNFEKKMDDQTGKYDKEEGLSDGPFGFGKSVKLKAGIEKEPDEVKFRYSGKATKNCPSSTFYLTLLCSSNYMWKMSQIFQNIRTLQADKIRT